MSDTLLSTPKPASLAPLQAAFVYSIADGVMAYGPASTRAGTIFASGLWSGHGEGRNNPNAVSQRGVGPLPPGLYVVGPLEAHHPVLGPCVMSLVRPDRNNAAWPTYGRSGFFVHGASATDAANSSDGCIIMPRAAREQFDVVLRALGSRRLWVTP